MHPGRLKTRSMELLRALLLLWMFARCMSSSEPPHNLDLQHLRLPEAVQGFKIRELYAKDRQNATAAYMECMQHGSGCKIPCSSSSNCLGCYPAQTTLPIGSKKNTKAAAKVCAYCLPGYKMSADRTSCQACPVGHTSKGGRATLCERCPQGLTTRTAGSAQCLPAPQKQHRPPGVRQDAGANCPLPIPAGIFNDSGNPACPSGLCKRLLNADWCGGIEAVDTQLCLLNCYDGAYGDSMAICANGTWVQESNNCVPTPTCSETCLQSGVWPSYCNPSTRQCDCRPSGDGGQPQFSYLQNAGCVTDTSINRGDLFNGKQECMVRVTENPQHADACATSKLYFGPSSTRCTQVSVASAPIRSMCPGKNCTTSNLPGGCWVQVWSGGAFGNPSDRLPGWIQSGLDCLTDPYGYLGPCPSSQCRVAPSSEACKVEDTAGLTMRQAPCITAPAVQQNRHDVVIPVGDTFQYLDRNSRQSSDCQGYNLPGASPDFCWVLGSYRGASGWVPVQQMPAGFFGSYTSSLCTYYNTVPTLLVSDDGSATGCAQLTRDASDSFLGCFPADSAVYLRNGATAHMRALKVGDEVAVRKPNGSIAYEPVYAFGHRDDDTAAEFVEVTVADEGSGTDGFRTLQATSDHFVLVGLHKPTYKRIGEVAHGDVMWVAHSAASTSLVSGTVVGVHKVVKGGLYAPLTLGGSILVNGVAASVHSKWFADDMWAALSLPDAWLHDVYQAALMPVRALWHVWPKYKVYYQQVEQRFAMATHVPNLWQFVGIMWSITADAAADVSDHVGPVLASTSIVALGAVLLATLGHCQGVSSRSSKRVVLLRPLLAVLCFCLVACVHSSRTQGDEQAGMGEHEAADEGVQVAPQNYEPTYPGYHSFGHRDEPSYYASSGSSDSGYPVCLPPFACLKPDPPSTGCSSPPNVALPFGRWSCPYDMMPIGSTCRATCDSAGYAEATCTIRGWSSTVSGACFDRKVCAGLPTVERDGAVWPEQCANTPVGGYCMSQCVGPSACSRSAILVVRCTRDGWATEAISAYNSFYTFLDLCADVSPDCAIPEDLPLLNGFWNNFCRFVGLEPGDTCEGICYSGLLLGPAPYVECTETGLQVFNSDNCAPL